MPLLWFSGYYSAGISPHLLTTQGTRFDLIRDSEDKDATFTLVVTGRIYSAKEDLKLVTTDPHRATQYFQTELGTYAFPWRWGHSSNAWPRLISPVEEVQLIRLMVERGQYVAFTPAYTRWMEVIQNIESSRRRTRAPKKASAAS